RWSARYRRKLRIARRLVDCTTAGASRFAGHESTGCATRHGDALHELRLHHCWRDDGASHGETVGRVDAAISFPATRHDERRIWPAIDSESNGPPLGTYFEEWPIRTDSRR